MVWKIKNKEEVVKTCFALFPVTIGDYRVWLSRYYKTWDLSSVRGQLGNIYIPHLFVYKENADKYVKEKTKKT